MVGLSGLEPPTSRLSGVRSNQLSYRPILTYSRNKVPSKLNKTGNVLFIRPKVLYSVNILRKEVIQPHLPIRLPCYDFTPIICPTFGGWLLKGYLTDFGCYKLSWCDGRCVQGPGTYSPRHADPRLLAIPASRSQLQTAIRTEKDLWDWLNLAVSLPFVLSIVARV